MENEPKPVVTGYPAAQQPTHPTTTGVPAHGTAYPYQAPPYYPPPPPAPPAPYYAPESAYGGNGGSSPTLVRRLMFISIAVLIGIGLAIFVVWVVFRPRTPVFAVASASVSSFNVSGATQQVSAEFNLSLSVRNPNKKVGISYNSVEAAVLYGSDLISRTSLPSFYQGKESSTVVPANFVAVATYVGADAANGIARERSSNGGAVFFDVRVRAWVRFQSGGWRTRKHILRVSCDRIKVAFANATASVGALAGPPQRCGVHI